MGRDPIKGADATGAKLVLTRRVVRVLPRMGNWRSLQFAVDLLIPNCKAFVPSTTSRMASPPLGYDLDRSMVRGGYL